MREMIDMDYYVTNSAAHEVRSRPWWQEGQQPSRPGCQYPKVLKLGRQ